MASELSTMMGAFSKDLLEAVIKTLEQDAAKIAQYKLQLTQKLIEARNAIQKYEMISQLQKKQQGLQNTDKSYQRLQQNINNFNTLESAADSLLKSYSESSDQIQLDVAEQTFEMAIINLYSLEHEIVDFLTNGLSATTQYAIYYDASSIPGLQGDATGEFFRGEISPQEIKQFFNVTSSGEIQLRRSKALIDKLQQNFKEDNTGTTKKYSTEGVWERLTLAILGNLQQQLYDWMEQLQVTNSIALKEHLGRKRYRTYDTLNKLFGFKNFDERIKYASSTLAQVYKKYMLLWNQNYSGFNMQSLAYSRGHIGEAFERYLVHAGSQTLEPTDEDIITYLNESVNNLPWFAGGDVGHTQVKTLFGDNSQVQIASAYTICELANELANLFLNPKDWIQRAKQRINTELQEGAANSEAKFTQVKDFIANDVGTRIVEGLAKTYKM